MADVTPSTGPTAAESVAASPPPVNEHLARKAALAGFIGTALEWYDYFLYGSAAALVFPQLFFNGMGPTVATLASLGSFGVSFLFRPLGGFIFGHLGDRMGRKKMLITTLMLMGGGSFLIGCLPTSAAIGALAPILLVLLRIVQGIGLGGEWGGAATVVIECAPHERRGLYTSSMQMGVPAGQLSSAGAVALFALLPNDQFEAWGWRIPFLLSGLLIIVGFWIRRSLEETPQFRAVEAANKTERAPIRDVLTTHWRPVILLIFVQAGATIAYYLLTVYVLVYVTSKLGLPRSWALTGVLVGAAVELMLIPIWAHASDKIGRRPVYAIGTLILALYAFPFFWLLDSASPWLICLAVVIGLGVGHAPTAALNGSLYAEQFPARLRYTGSSISYQMSSVVAGAPAAIVAAWLVEVTGSSRAVSIYVLIGCLVSLAAVAMLRETKNRPLEL
jgi:MFS transporter, MHS family, shikimate and dehydroshikimate transport protein